jgi:DNA-binding SARP family transcriptional activator
MIPNRLEGVALKLVALDPGNEEAYRCLMRSSASRHDLAEVIERYRLLRGERRSGARRRAFSRDEAVAG